MLARIKRINSHAGLYRFLQECRNEGEIAGYIPRQKDIPTPYSSGPTHGVYQYKGANVIVAETAHKRYDIFAVPSSIPISAEDV